MQQLKPSTILQGGKYRIERVLGQGGFGITYSAVQVTLNRRVAIKEFFMKEYCERNADTSHVTLGTASGAELVNRFKEKFLKEAALIAQFDNPHIVRIYDIFEENDTAYYVMEFLEDRWSQFGRHGTPWELSLNLIKQVGDGLSYLHSQNVLHLDVKPSNILFRKDCAVLIDFGISKRYDSQGGQTSTTPVGISKGFAPLEQYNQGVQIFQPATDIYSLGATLYKILTGETPPEASEVMNYGLPTEILRAKQVPEKIISVIQKSMEPRVVQRYQSVSQLFDAIGEVPRRATWGKDTTQTNIDERTIMFNPSTGSEKEMLTKPDTSTSSPTYEVQTTDSEQNNDLPKPLSLKRLFIILASCVGLLVVLSWYIGYKNNNGWVTKDIYMAWGNGTYVGNLKHGLPDGNGHIDFQNGATYEGSFREGDITGKGVYKYPNGQIKYEGEYLNGKRHGQGTAYYSNGEIAFKGIYYQGNKKDGYGKESGTNPDGLKWEFEGEYKDYMRNGKGTMHWSNGDTYEGDWKDGERTGNGTYLFNEKRKGYGYKYVGGFLKGEYHGEGIWYYVGGGSEKCTYKNGKQIK